jgi:hypothetical protein
VLPPQQRAAERQLPKNMQDILRLASVDFFLWHPVIHGRSNVTTADGQDSHDSTSVVLQDGRHLVLHKHKRHKLVLRSLKQKDDYQSA